MRKILSTKLNIIAIAIGLVALLASYIIFYLAFTDSISREEAKLYGFYGDKAHLLTEIIKTNSVNSEQEVLEMIENIYRHSAEHPPDEYVCIVDERSNLILHTSLPETVGNYAGNNSLEMKGEQICTLNDLVINHENYIGHYISGLGEKQIAAFEFIPSLRWTLGVHRSREQLRSEVVSHYKWMFIAIIIISILLLPLSLGLLFWFAKASNSLRISQEIESKETLMKAKEKAEESDRLKTTFLANLSHEIRTPMNGILGFAGLLKKDNIPLDKQKIFLSTIEKSGIRMLNLINDLVNISKIEANQLEVNPEEMDLNSLMEDQYIFFKRDTDEKGLSLSYNVDIRHDRRSIIADKTKLDQILSNLIKNAIKFSSRGEIKFGCELQGSNLLFKINDTGSGIPKEKQEHIFERFRQSDDNYLRAEEGSGLGLAISKSFVELMGGKIWVESTPGSGSVFSFTIPYIPSEKEMLVSTDSEPQISFENASVLVVEDDLISYMLIEELLDEFKITAIHASNGKECLEIIESNKNINLVLLDIKMPVMNGWDTMKLLQEKEIDIPVIIQSAHVSATEKRRAFEAGCVEYLSKPIDRVTFINVLEKILNKTL